MTIKKRLMIAIPVLLVILGITAVFNGWFSSSLALDGIVETNIYPHYSEVTGKIIELPIELGQQVKAGDVLAVLDSSNQQTVLDELEQALVIKQALLTTLSAGARPEELKQRQNNVALAEVAYSNAQLTRDQAKTDYSHALALYKVGAIAKTELDKAKYQADITQAAVTTTADQLDNAKQQLAVAEAGGTAEEIASAQAEVNSTQLQIDQAQDNLAKFQIVALQDGTITSKNYLLGNMANPGYDLFEIASETEKHLVTYVPKTHLARIELGQEVTIKSGGKNYTGSIEFIDVKAQYTPRDMQSLANKNKESMKVKITLPADIPLKVGETAQVMIP